MKQTGPEFVKFSAVLSRMKSRGKKKKKSGGGGVIIKLTHALIS